ncbi:MAG: integrase/recombinase XerD [Thermoanaerobacteraceae bacterium]|nr:integrase/recombinase XerD [Thermoanaerobacteraceae bacterium]
MEWKSALKLFLGYKKAQNVSARTLQDYEYFVSQFFKRFPNAFNDEKLKSAAYEYLSDDMKPATYNLRLNNLRVFINFCIKEGYISKNPFKDFKHRKADNRIVQIDADIFKKLLKLPNLKTFAGLRDYALILLTLDTGIRPSEAFSLLIDNINLDAMEVYVRSEEAKTRIKRTLPISYVTVNALQKLINARPKDWGKNIPLFCTEYGTKLNRHRWADRMRRYSEELGIKIMPYSLRHGFALQFLRNGGNAFALQRLLGHTDMAMTKRYVALTDDDLREQHKESSPLNIILPKKQRIRNIKPRD